MVASREPPPRAPTEALRAAATAFGPAPPQATPTVTALTESGFGARLRGLDLRRQPLPAGAVAAIRAAAAAHGGLLVIDPPPAVSAGAPALLTKAEIAGFSRQCFGELQRAPASEGTSAGELAALGEGAFVWPISNVVDRREAFGGALGSAELEWHSDMSFAARPPTFSVLLARECPADGRPATSFASMSMAYQVRKPPSWPRTWGIHLQPLVVFPQKRMD